jgi:TolA-binding protein
MKRQATVYFTLALSTVLSLEPRAAEAQAAAAEPAAEAEETPSQPAIPQPSYGGLSLGSIKPPTPEDEAALKELAEDIEIFNRNSESFREAIKNIIKREYEIKKKLIEDEFSKQIDEEERLEEEARKSAIEHFESFLAKYPDNAEYTPDAMFRLSELYYEQSYVEHLKAYDIYREDYNQWKKGKLAQEPVEPTRDFSMTIDIYEQLIERYPDYRNLDAVYYLLGYCWNEMGKFDEAKLVWLTYVCSNKFTYEDVRKEIAKKAEATEWGGEEEKEPAASLPKVTTAGKVESEEIFAPEATDTYKECRPLKENSRFFTETWLRIGEYHFDFDYSKTGLANAISAYSKALEDPTSSFYDLALYKLAWSYWRKGDYPAAIQHFIEVVEYSDKKAEETGKSGSQLRPEAVQYIALSLWESDWDGDNVPDKMTGFERLKDPNLVPQDRPWTHEVYNWLGDVYVDDNANLKAIEVFEEYLKRWPNAPEAPEVVVKIAKAYQREKMEQKVIDTRARLAAYGKDSDWWNANMDKPELQEKALVAAEEALKQTALHHHEVAQNLKNAAKAKTSTAEQNELYQRAIEEYNLAATAYQKYLDTYPNSGDAYEMNFFLAETYFWSKQYEKSIPVYEAVRDSQMDNRYQKDAAFMVVKAIEQEREEEIAKGMLTVRKEPPDPVTGPDGKPAVQPEPMPSILTRYISAMDTYTKLFPADTKNATVFVYNAAELYYNYGSWDEAKTRFQNIYEAYCTKDDIAAYSWQNLSAMASKLQQDEESGRLAELQKEKQCGVGNELKLSMNDTSAKVLDSLEAKTAMDMFYQAEKTGDVSLYEQVADKLEMVVNKNPKHEDADKMLWNAAVSYEKCNKFSSALRVTQRIVDEYPKSEFMGDSLFKLADNSFKAFEYNKAVANYKILADEPRFKDSPHRKPATQNTALILDNQQKYKEAAVYWKKFSEMTDKQEEAIEALWNAAKGYEKGKQWASVVTEMRSFTKRFAGAPEAAEFQVEAEWSIAQAYKKMGKNNDYEKALADVITKYNMVKNNLKPGAMSIDHAAEAKFILVEKGLPGVEKYKLNTNNEKKVTENLKALKDMRDNLIAQYVQVVNMASPEWSVAAQFRIGYLYETHSKIILDAPIPASVTKLGAEAEEMYRDKIMSIVTPLEDEAKVEYAKAMQLSKAAGVFTKWTELTLERLNAYSPDEYPIYIKGKTKKIKESYGAASFDTKK